ncbi:rRNA maturation RNase YbeY [Candidatus Parcubacteria bacterium]|nr:rRNA maturation RNase YbeY [Candidatus Parcubacteria bacterium]
MVEINNLTTSSVDEEFIQKIIQQVLQGEGIKEEIELSLAFVGPGRMREINKRYRGKNRATDILSFPESKILMQKFKIGPTEKIPGLGEMIICLREVKKNAKRMDLAFEKELTKVVIHGLLHLLGHDHEKEEAEAVKMQKKEDHYLEIVL